MLSMSLSSSARIKHSRSITPNRADVDHTIAELDEGTTVGRDSLLDTAHGECEDGGLTA